MTGKFLRRHQISFRLSQQHVKKKKKSYYRKLLEELNFLVGFKFQEANKIACAFESLQCDFWSKKCSGLLMLAWCVYSLPKGKSLIWSCLWFSLRTKRIQFCLGPEQPQRWPAQYPGSSLSSDRPMDSTSCKRKSLCLQGNLEECTRVNLGMCVGEEGCQTIFTPK